MVPAATCVLALNALSVFLLLFRLQINDGSRELGKGLIGCLFFFEVCSNSLTAPSSPWGRGAGAKVFSGW